MIPIRRGIEIVFGGPGYLLPGSSKTTGSEAIGNRFLSRIAGSGQQVAQTTGISMMAAMPGTETSPDIDVEDKLKDAFARGWSVIVWNDPINLMDYVVHIFKTVLKMNEQDASRHMWEVHQNGKSVVAQETREKSELLVHRLRGFGLNATLEQA